MLPRLHLVEFEDLEWFPKSLRDGATRFLREMSRFQRLDRLFLKSVERVIDKTGHTRLIDLCSGGGGPFVDLIRQLHRKNSAIHGVMTDLYPNLDAFSDVENHSEGTIVARREPTDATDVPSELAGIRTIFNGFHHLPPPLAENVLADCVRKKSPIVIGELASRDLGLMLAITLGSPLLAVALVPFSRPFKLTNLLFTAIPLIPALVSWDGFVSCWRVYTAAELHDMIRRVDPDQKFEWHVRSPSLPRRPATILTGWLKPELSPS